MHLTAACALLITEGGADGRIAQDHRGRPHCARSTAGRSPLRLRQAGQAEVETLLATDPDAAAAALARHVDRFAGNATFLLWASQTFSELAAARPSHGLPDRTLATEAWAALLCTVVLPPGDDDQGLRLIDRPTGSTCAAPGCVARRSPGHCWPGRATTSTSAPSCGWRCWPATTGWPNGCSANR